MLDAVSQHKLSTLCVAAAEVDKMTILTLPRRRDDAVIVLTQLVRMPLVAHSERRLVLCKRI